MANNRNRTITLKPRGSGVFSAATYAGNVVPAFKCPESRHTRVVIESPQSVANLLENRLWDAINNRPIEALLGVPYLELRDDDGVYKLSSRDTPHRVASGHFANTLVKKRKDEEGESRAKAAKAAIKEDRGLTFAAVADPIAFLFGFWFSQWGLNADDTSRSTRCFVGRIVANEVAPVPRGGVQKDLFDKNQKKTAAAPKETKEAAEKNKKGNAALGVGMIPITVDKGDLLVATSVVLYLDKIQSRFDGLKRLPFLGEEISELADAAYEFAVSDLIASGELDLRSEAIFEISGSDDTDVAAAEARLKEKSAAYVAARANLTGEEVASLNVLETLNLDEETGALWL